MLSQNIYSMKNKGGVIIGN